MAATKKKVVGTYEFEGSEHILMARFDYSTNTIHYYVDKDIVDYECLPSHGDMVARSESSHDEILYPAYRYAMRRYSWG